MSSSLSIPGLRREGRPLPVFVLADTSGSMQGSKISALNTGLGEMLDILRSFENPSVELKLCVITFGDRVDVAVPLADPRSVTLPRLSPSGMTPMGAAFDLVAQMITDQAVVPHNAFAPTIALLTDGMPNDAWQPALQRLLTHDRTRKATRFAMAIGHDADQRMLESFLDNPEAEVYRSHEPEAIRNFLRQVSLYSVKRAQSNPNVPLPVPAIGSLDDDIFDN